MELAEKLKRQFASSSEVDDDINIVLDKLADSGAQSDERFAEVFCRSAKKKFGDAKIIAELKKRGISDDIIRQFIPRDSENEIVRAKEILHKRFGGENKDGENRKKLSAAEYGKRGRFLQSRGFSTEAIRAALRQADDN